MTPRFLVAALVLAWAAPAAATTYSVSPTGTGTACTPGSPCALSTANASVQPGDLVLMANGAYGTAPIPARSGTSSAPIEYRGNPANKNAVVVPAMTAVNGQDYIRWRYFRVNSAPGAGFRLEGQLEGCRVAGLTVIGDFMVAGFNAGAIESVAVYPPISGGTIAYNYFNVGGQSCPLNGGGSISNSTFNACSVYVRSESGHQYCFDADPIFKMWGAMKTGLRVTNNVFRVVLGPGSSGGARGLYLGNMQNSTFIGNKWVIADSAGVCVYGNGCITARIRDYFLSNTFTNDTFEMVNANSPFYLSSQGDPNDRTTEGRNKWKGCTFKSTNSAAFLFDWGIRGDTIQNCVVMSNFYGGLPGGALPGPMVIPAVAGSGLTTLIDHNTFATFVSPTTNGTGALNTPIGSAIGVPGWESGALMKVTNNIFYRPFTTTSGASAAASLSSQGGSAFTSNNNLFAYYAGPNRSISYSGIASAPGTGGSWYAATGRDGASRYGSPMFTDSSFANFDPRLRAGSAAIGFGIGGTDVGAIPFTPAGPDVIPPATILNLSAPVVSDQMVTLNWTAPGDDGMTGVASDYDLRRSTTLITDTNFGSATSVTTGPPGPSGSSQATVITGLSPGTTYYFAIKTRDENNNWSLLGNVLQVTTAGTDPLAPSTVRDLGTGP